MNTEFDKTYKPGEFEKEVSSIWEKNGCFHADVESSKPKFSIVLPPPNVTGQLHMGHALNITLQDILVRFKRMNGFETLWLPGVDHAAIATEAKIVEFLKKQGTTKNELGREKFLEVAFDWKNKFETRIFNQIKSLGASCDFARKRFTMDEGCAKAVKEFFTRLYDEGLIYKGDRVINWCFYCKTSISDVEVEHKEKNGFFWRLKYVFEDGDGFIEVATTRPETLFGDVAVAVNPNDDRYKNLIGKKVIVPLVGTKIPIVADSYVDMEFGTGAVKITPAHDFNDFEVGMRQGLPAIRVIDYDGRLNEKAGRFKGLKIEAARDAVVEGLKVDGLLIGVEPHVHNVGCCYRCSNVVEPIISKQWFVKMKTLAGPAIEVVKKDLVKFVPPYFEKTYFNWLDGVKDWCISRQLWWGHQIPAWYCESCGHIMVAKNAPTVCEKCGKTNLQQDPDTLDTWFSAALWPYATLGWPNESSADYRKFYPTDLLVTGYDIIFFWVVRMVFSALKNTGKAPFSKVLIHGIVRDSQGRKMSKSLGNGIDPLEIIDKVGADALRFFLASNTNAGSDVRFSEEKLLSARNFVNKLWNASRFIFLNVEKFGSENLNCVPEQLEIEDLWFLSKLSSLIQQVTHNIENFEISVASQKLYDFVWDIFCGWFVELAKIRLNSGGDVAKRAISVLTYGLHKILKLLHPFMPFISEKINFLLFGNEKFEILAVADWPKFSDSLVFEEGLEFEKVVDSIGKIRHVRAEMKMDKSKKIKVFVETKFVNLFKKCAKFFNVLVGAVEFVVYEKIDLSFLNNKNFVKVATDSARIFIDVSEAVDFEKERNRLLKELENCKNEVKFYEKKLSNEQFLAKAPEKILNLQKSKLVAAKLKLEKISKSLSEF